MGRSSKIILVGAVFLIGVAAALFAALRFLPETQAVRSRLEEKLRDVTGQDVHLGPLNVSLSLPNPVRLSVEGISVSSPEGKRLVSAERVILYPALLPLFRREIAVESITVIGLEARVEKPRGEPENKPAVPRQSAPQTASPEGRPGPDRQSGGIAGVTPVKEGLPPVASEERGSFKWSVNSIRFVGGKVEWVDRYLAPGKEVVISLREFEGALTRAGEGGSMLVNFNGKIGAYNAQAGPVSIEGSIKPSEDLSTLLEGRVAVSSERLNLALFSAYTERLDSALKEFDSAKARAEFTLKEGEPLRASLTAGLRSAGKDKASVDVHADVIAARDLSTITEVRSTLETDGLPFRMCRTYVPAGLPLDPDSGVIKALVRGEWRPEAGWRAEAGITLENAAPTGVLKSLGGPLRLWVQTKADPDRIVMDTIELSGTGRIASGVGTISKPFSVEPALDLKGDVLVRPAWLKGFGVDLPKGLEITGDIPLACLVRGRIDDLWLDLKGDLGPAEIRWLPHLRKAGGNSGNLSVKGKLFSLGSGKLRNDKGHALVRLSLAGTDVRVAGTGKWTTKLAVQGECSVVPDGTGLGLREVVLAFRTGSEAADMLTAKGQVSGVGSAEPRFEGTATLLVDPRTPALVGMELPPDIELRGNAPLKASFRGTAKALEWSAELPLAHLDIAVQKAFRKPGGVVGSLQAAGKLAGNELTLASGKLTLPGFTLYGEGMIRDKQGNFPGMTLSAKKTDLKDVVKFIPPAAGMGLSGPVEAVVRLKPGAQSTTPGGTVRLHSMDVRPEKASWGLTGVKGVLEIDGTSVDIVEASGNLEGTVNGPFTAKGVLHGVESADSLNGKISLAVGKGRFKEEKLSNALAQVRQVIGVLTNPTSSDRKDSPLEFQSISGDLRVRSGAVHTENLTLKGQDLNCGAIGSYRLNKQEIDMLLGVRTMTAAGQTLGKIPEVRKLVKKHEDVLKITGLDKELKRFGIGGDDNESDKPDANPSATPVTAIFKMSGPASSLRVTPVLETGLDKGTVTRLKSLIN